MMKQGKGKSPMGKMCFEMGFGKGSSRPAGPSKVCSMVSQPKKSKKGK